MRFLKEKKTINLRKYIGKVKVNKRTKIKEISVIIDNDDDQNLFTALKAKRMELAKAQNVPPYVIFHDKTLIEFAIKKPQDNESMAQISGVGEKKIVRYGTEFLSVIEGYI